MSSCRQNYNIECEAAINKFINQKLHASYTYQSMAFYFDRDDIALPGFQEQFKELSKCKQNNIEKLKEFQNKRGGRIVLQDIQKPIADDWKSPEDAIQAALNIEKDINKEAISMYEQAEKHGDEHMADFIEDTFLEPEVSIIKKLSDLATNLKRVGSGLGTYIFDKETLQ